MLAVSRSAAAAVGLAIVLFFGAGWSRAEAVVITVAGTHYDVRFFDFGRFNDNIAILTAPDTAPWWGNSGLAEAFANAYSAQVSPPPYPFDTGPGSAPLTFAQEFSGDDLFGWLVEDDGGVQPRRDSPVFLGTYAYVAPAAVPEIDGNAMAKALFVLFTLWLWLQIRRNRRAG